MIQQRIISYEIKLKPEPPFGILSQRQEERHDESGTQPAPIHKELPPGKRVGLIAYNCCSFCSPIFYSYSILKEISLF